MMLKDIGAVVTGGAQGLGEALAARLLQEGALVLVADVQEAAIARAVGALEAAYPGRVAGRRCDVTDEAAVTAALGMTPPIAPVAILPIGRSAESSGKPARRPLAEVTTWL